MMVIPLPQNKLTRLGRNNVAATDPEITTYMLNTEEYSHNVNLLSRTHCELWFEKTGKLMMRDGGRSAETGVTKGSVNASSAQGIVIPFGGEIQLREGDVIDLGTPHLVPDRRLDTPHPNEFVYRVEAETRDCFRGALPRKKQKRESEPETHADTSTKTADPVKKEVKAEPRAERASSAPSDRVLRKRKSSEGA